MSRDVVNQLPPTEQKSTKVLSKIRTSKGQFDGRLPGNLLYAAVFAALRTASWADDVKTEELKKAFGNKTSVLGLSVMLRANRPDVRPSSMLMRPKLLLVAVIDKFRGWQATREVNFGMLSVPVRPAESKIRKIDVVGIVVEYDGIG